jgi:hypothetical protein
MHQIVVQVLAKFEVVPIEKYIRISVDVQTLVVACCVDPANVRSSFFLSFSSSTVS